jgi:serine protease Do
MRKNRPFTPAFLLILSAILAGSGVVSMPENAAARDDVNIAEVKQSLSDNVSLSELGSAFRKVAEIVEPSVVHIQVSARQRDRSSREMMPDDEMLRRFFGPHFWKFYQDQQDDPDSPENTDPREPQTEEDYRRYNVPQVFGTGSGWIYDEQGHIITNNHVIENADVITVRFLDGTEQEATVVGTDPKSDIAVIQIKDASKFRPATLARKPVEQGDIVFAFGSPFQFEFSMSQGIVSAKGRRLGLLNARNRGGGYENFIQTDAAINPGNSGGPLTNIYGEVVGMNSAIATRTGSNSGLGFAIPVDMIKNIAGQILESGQVQRGYLGILIQDLSPKMAKTFNFSGEGVLIGQVLRGEAAEKGGIKNGDIITHINGEPVSTADQLRNTVADFKPGTELTLDVFRAGQNTQINIKIGELPGNPNETESPVSPDADPSSHEDQMQTLRKLGVQDVITMTTDLAEKAAIDFTPGVLIGNVREGSIAEAAGLAPKQIITHVMDQPVKNKDDLLNALGDLDLSQGVRLTIVDGDNSRFVYLELSE